MIELFSILIVTFVDLCKIIFCMNYLFSFHIKLRTAPAVFSFFVYIAIIFYQSQNSDTNHYFSLMIFPFILIILLLHHVKLTIKVFFLIMTSYLLICQIDIFISRVIELFIPVTNPFVNDIIIAVISFFIVFFVCRFCRFRKIHVETQDYTSFIFTQLVFLVLAGALSGATGNLIDEAPDGFYHDTLYFNISALSLLISFSGFLIFFLIRSNRHYREVQTLQAQLAQAQKDYSAQVLSQNNLLRSFRHDVRGHLVSLRHYLENQDISSALNYIDEIDDRISVSVLKFRTQNPIVDALVNAKVTEMEQNHISCTLTGSLPQTLPLTDFDQCQLISNLLNNAIEANLALPEDSEKFIYFEMAYLPDCFSLRVSNPIKETSDLKTKKADKKNHGMGLKNIAACADRYHGTFEIFQKNSLFTAEISIPGSFSAPGEPQ